MGPMSMAASWGTPGRLGVAGSGGEYGWKLEGFWIFVAQKKQAPSEGGILVYIIVYSEYIHIYLL